MGESLIQPTLVGPPIDPMECATFLDRTSVPEGAGMVRGPAGAPAGTRRAVPKVPGGWFLRLLSGTEWPPLCLRIR
jgi:hypothetical protein